MCLFFDIFSLFRINFVRYLLYYWYENTFYHELIIHYEEIYTDIRRGIKMKANRSGEVGQAPPRSSRLFHMKNLWYFSTREGADIGPFGSRDEANHGLQDFLQFLQLANNQTLQNFLNTLASGNNKNLHA